MIPLAAAPADIARARVLAFDVDDTVTRHGKLETIALDAMYRARDAGLVLIAATGRPIGWAEVFVATWPVAAAIGENGAGVCLPFSPTSLVLDRDAARARREAAIALVRDRFPSIKLAADDALRRVDVAFDIGEREVVDETVIDALRAALEGAAFVTTRSTVHVHAMPCAYDKATGIERALALLGQTIDDVAFVGDSPNDAGAFARFPLSFGVANVCDHAARIATLPNYVTRGDRGEGFAELVDALIARRGGSL